MPQHLIDANGVIFSYFLFLSFSIPFHEFKSSNPQYYTKGHFRTIFDAIKVGKLFYGD